ncbi:EamA family transporter RarD [Stenoxybacter acetivorans]|uniref:EamA family transporter RarD n=1 Tax=Stenoxybacter acetivorans TaxID=422441 RepID=UPI000564F7A4|nr:EamA family transporter RarD [Stenoxybacter acetivorans]
MSNLRKGTLFALLSNLLFGVLYLYSGWMKPLSGSDVFAWRMVSMLLALWLVVLITRNGHEIFRFAYKIGKDKKKWALIVLPTPIVASQLWLFMWAPVNGYAVDVAMGYFLFPLAMVLCARVFFKEKLNAAQWLAVALAAMGVMYELWRTHAFSWVTLWVFSTYPIYYFLRRHFGVPALTGLLLDLTLIAPFAAVYLYWQTDVAALLSAPSLFWLLIPFLGIISAAAMLLNLQANRLLPSSIFGMMSYLEPIILFLLAITVLHNPIAANAIPTYILIWLGLSVMIFDGWRKTKMEQSC